MSQTNVMSFALLPVIAPITGVAFLCMAGKTCIEKLIQFGINPPRQAELESISTRCKSLEAAYRSNLAGLEKRRLESLNSDSRSAERVNRLEAMYKAVSQSPLYRTTSESQNPGHLEAVGRSLGDLASRKKGESSQRELDALSRDLTGLISKADRTLQKVESETTQEVITHAMASLGYEKNQTGSRLRFSKGRKVIFAETAPNRTLTLNASGFQGRSCTKALGEIREELNQLGLSTELLSVQPHRETARPRQAVEPEQFFNEMLCRELEEMQPEQVQRQRLSV